MQQFTDSYSDDFHYLCDARELLLKDESKIRIPELIDAAFCRLLAIHIIGSIEMMIERWLMDLSQASFRDYFAKGVTYEQKAEILIAGFGKLGLQFDYDIVKDYAAVKLLRNRIVHSKEGGEAADGFLIDRGFPVDVRYLSSEHWNRMQKVYEKMMEYIASIGIKFDGRL